MASLAIIPRSVFLSTILIICLLDIVCGVIDPVKYFRADHIVHANCVISKLRTFFRKAESCDVLLLGSSLMLYPSVRSDETLEKKPHPSDSSYIRDIIDQYLFSRYLEQDLLKQSGRSMSVRNLATAASLVSDQYFILRRYVSSGRRVKVLCCDLSPRGFLDNYQPDPLKTPVFLDCVKAPTGIELLGNKLSLGYKLQLFGARFSSVLRERDDLKVSLVDQTAKAFGHPVSLFSAATSAAPRPFKASRMPLGKLSNAADKIIDEKEYYKKAYLPVDESRLEKQFDYLRRILQTAKTQNILVILSFMPLPKDNRELLPANFWQMYKDRAISMAREFNAVVYDSQMDVAYTNADFEDLAHLNYLGAQKYMDGLSKIICDIVR